MKNKKLFKGVLIICAILIGLTGCSKEKESAAQKDGPKILKVRINADIKNLDPARRYSRWDDVISATIFDGLVSYKANSYDIENVLAEKFEISEDGHEIYFKLREGVQFQKGAGEVTAEDVKFSYERFRDEKTASAYSDDWANLDHVEVISKYEGKIILTEPFAPLMRTTLPLNSGVIVPKNYIEKVGLDGFTTDVIGCGPYYIDEWQPDQKVVVKKNPDYYGKAPYWDEIQFIVISDNQSAEIALQAGEVDFAEISTNTVDTFKDNPDFGITSNSDLDYRWIGLNVENPKLQDVNVRKAIRAAANVPDMITAAYNGMVEQETAIVAPGLLGYWADAPKYTQDLDKAKEYMAAAGIDSLDLEIAVADTSEYRVWAEVLQQNLKEIGINLEINSMESGTFWEIGDGDKGKDVELFAMAFQMQPDPSWATMWFTSDQVGIWNWMRWANPEFDELHKQGLSETDDQKRQVIYEKMQKLMDDDAVAIWVTNGKTYFAYNAKKCSPAMTPNNSLQFRFFSAAK
ncbi:MAG: ABC transporter substrate-binding protein [Spirochaetales bacterium]|nr:ABC transporter substrate-binding protein [Spirochaetales bacterium]